MFSVIAWRSGDHREDIIWLLQIIVHTTGHLIAQKILWCGQSERIVRLSTAKCYREYLIDVPVDNEYQQNAILGTEASGQ